jgi:hypothetical protein
MRILLHILTQPEDDLGHQVIGHQLSDPENEVRIYDLTQPDPNYDELLRQIFQADGILLW